MAPIQYNLVDKHMNLSENLNNLSLSSRAIHADDSLKEDARDVVPQLHLSTTFHYNENPDLLFALTDQNTEPPRDGHIYSRISNPNTTRLEAILSSVLNGPTLVYSSGLSAFHALLVFFNPKNISISDGYHGCHSVIEIHKRLTGINKLDLHCDPSKLNPGDLVHVETPLNPTGKAINIKHFADKAHSRGAYLSVDATFAPPPLQDPFLWGADIVMHSGTKYIGGHSDLLCGILAINPARVKDNWLLRLSHERRYLGNVMGNMECWLGIRSIRTLKLRVEKQSSNATQLVKWLNSAINSSGIEDVNHGETQIIRHVLAKVEHASLQEDAISNGWLSQQMPTGFGPVFSITMKGESYARNLPSKLHLYHHATSLGSVESLIEWRIMSDLNTDPRLLRISTGIEELQDLKDDLLQGFGAILIEKEQRKT